MVRLPVLSPQPIWTLWHCFKQLQTAVCLAVHRFSSMLRRSGRSCRRSGTRQRPPEALERVPGYHPDVDPLPEQTWKLPGVWKMV